MRARIDVAHRALMKLGARRRHGGGGGVTLTLRHARARGVRACMA